MSGHLRTTARVAVLTLLLTAANAVRIAAAQVTQQPGDSSLAKVIVLDTDDATEARSIQLQEAALEVRRGELRERITRRYLISGICGVYPSPRVFSYHAGLHSLPVCDGVYKIGWEAGFEFSEDYKAIVAVKPIITDWNYQQSSSPIYYPADWFHFLTPPGEYPRIVTDAYGTWRQCLPNGAWQFCGLGTTCQ